MTRSKLPALLLVVVGACTGEDGVSYLTTLTDEPAGANCVSGGVKVATGADDDHDGTLSASETETTKYVCNGEDSGSGSTAGSMVVRAFSTSSVAATATAQTILSAEITVPAGGEILALGSVDLFCSDAECPGTGNPPASGYFWVSPVNNLGVPATEFDYFYLAPNQTESLSRTYSTTLGTPGTFPVYLRGQKLVGGDFAYSRAALTIVYLP
jgi:hypothetical protein